MILFLKNEIQTTKIIWVAKQYSHYKGIKTKSRTRQNVRLKS